MSAEPRRTRRSGRRWIVVIVVAVLTMGLLVACARTVLGPYEWEAVGRWQDDSVTLELRLDGSFSASGLDAGGWPATAGSWKIDNFAGPDSADFAVVLWPTGGDSYGTTSRSFVLEGGIFDMRLSSATWDADVVPGLVLER